MFVRSCVFAVLLPLSAPAMAQNVGILHLDGTSTGCIFPNVGAALASPSFLSHDHIMVRDDLTVREPVSWGTQSTEFYVGATTTASSCTAFSTTRAQLEWDSDVSLVTIDGVIATFRDLWFTNPATIAGSPDEGYFLRAIDGATLNVERSRFTSGHVTSNGGAIFADNANVAITHTLFEGNSADKDGGAIYATSSTGTHSLDVFGGRLVENVALRRGGAVASDGVDLEFARYFDPVLSTWEDPHLDDNEAERGGAVAFDADGFSVPFNTYMVWMEGNRAVKEGGAMFLQGASGIIERADLRDNQVTGTDPSDTGGAILAEGSDLELLNVLSASNTNVNGLGGAIAMRATIMEANHVTQGGSNSFGFAADTASSLVVQGSIVWANTAGAVIGPVTAACTNTQGGALPGPLNRSLAPKFAAPGAGDFHLTFATPLAIRAACPVMVVNEDLDGLTRTVNTSMGAYELN